VAGELTRDSDRDDRPSLTALLKSLPALVEAAGALVSARLDGGGLSLPAPLECRAGPEGSPLVPGRFDE
jgi:hypothetical protein